MMTVSASRCIQESATTQKAENRGQVLIALDTLWQITGTSRELAEKILEKIIFLRESIPPKLSEAADCPKLTLMQSIHEISAHVEGTNKMLMDILECITEHLDGIKLS